MYQHKHTFISIVLSDGAPPLWVSSTTGVSLATIYKHYAKWISGQRDGNQFVAGLWGGAPTPITPPVPPAAGVPARRRLRLVTRR